MSNLISPPFVDINDTFTSSLSTDSINSNSIADNHTLAKDSVDIPKFDNYNFSWKKLWAFSGPGIIMAIAYIDPGIIIQLILII